MPLIVQSSLAPQRPILLATKRGSDRIGFLYAKKYQIKNGLYRIVIIIFCLLNGTAILISMTQLFDRIILKSRYFVKLIMPHDQLKK